MKIKALVAAISCTALVMSVNASAISVNEASNLSYVSLAERYSIDVEPLEDVDYISFDEYRAKYGTYNVIRGFNEAEAKNMREVLSISSPQKATLMAESLQVEKSSEPNYLFESLLKGEFMGLEIKGISDLEPNDPRMMLELEAEDIVPAPSGFLSGNNTLANSSTGSIKHGIDEHGSDYDMYYTDPNLYGYEYIGEEKAGSYMYKFSHWNQGFYTSRANFVFNNTELYCGSQSNNMYMYINATSSKQHVDFGFVANPDAPERSSGLYVTYMGIGDPDKNGDPNKRYTSTYPVVPVVITGSGYMKLANTTVTVGLAVGNGTVEFYMAIGDQTVHYSVCNEFSGLVSGVNELLGFLHGVSCVESNGMTTDTNSGSYLKNVKIDNPIVISYTDGERPFGVFDGSATNYIILYKPDNMTYSYTDTSETISIIYD